MVRAWGMGQVSRLWCKVPSFSVIWRIRRTEQGARFSVERSAKKAKGESILSYGKWNLEPETWNLKPGTRNTFKTLDIEV
jgi:hypothetical protein